MIALDRARKAARRGPRADRRRPSRAATSPSAAIYASRNASLNSRIVRSGSLVARHSTIAGTHRRRPRSPRTWVRPRSATADLRASAKIGRLVEPLVAGRQNLVGADHQRIRDGASRRDAPLQRPAPPRRRSPIRPGGPLRRLDRGSRRYRPARSQTSTPASRSSRGPRRACRGQDQSAQSSATPCRRISSL